MDLLIRRWRVEVEQGFYISAHELLPVIVSLPLRGGWPAQKIVARALMATGPTVELCAPQVRALIFQFGQLSLSALKPDDFGPNRPEIWIRL
ncbi:hypothetical protein [Rhizobium leguminosarum]|uniref:hypothetical protein n=1 Tax=Rhizobium leguminosarum TaxID=384 RepID=UPI0013EE55A2|nr:hypothetical protein [Rhizobium leguminosarum]